MKKFKFKFEVLLEKAEEVEQECILSLKEVRNIIYEATRRLELMLTDKKEIIDQMKESANNKFNILVFKERKIYIEELNGDILQAKEEIFKLEQIEEQRLEQLKEAKKQVNIYEKLKEKQYRRYIDKIKKLEEKELEEIIMNNYVK